jgi:adenylate cyclase
VTVSGSEDPDVQVLLDHLQQVGADPEAVAAAKEAGRLGALVVEVAATGGRGIPFDQAVADTALDPAQATTLWRALGFPDATAAPSQLLLQDDDVQMLTLMSMTATDLLGEPATLRLARIIGEATSKVGDAVVGAFRERVEAPSRLAGAPYAETVSTYAALVSSALPGLQDAVAACVRRHVVQAAASSWSLPAGEAQPRRDLVVAFVDLTGWTALSRAASHSALARLVQQFEDLVATCAAGQRTRVVKFMGDGAMVVGEDATAVCRFGLDLVAAAVVNELLPPVRVGIAGGAVLPSGGDFHGAPVNLAARLVAVAEPSQVLVAEDVRAAAIGIAFGQSHVVELRGLLDPMHAAPALLAVALTDSATTNTNDEGP